MVRIKNNKLLLALLLLLPLSSQAQKLQQETSQVSKQENVSKLQQENTKKPRRVYFMPITFGEFRLMPDTTIESSFNIGMINGVTKQRGLSLGVVSNINHNLRGIQMSGITNISSGVDKGLQLSSAVNVSAGYMRGLQVAAYNYADTLNGSQIGLLNVAVSHPRGVQIGLLNYTRDTIAKKIGLVNINPKTTIDYMAFAGTTSKINGALRFRNRSTYNIIGIGSHYMGLDSKFSGAIYYRLGQYFNITPRLSLSGDVGYYHIETFRDQADKPKRLYSLQAHINADYQLNRYIGFYGSLGYGDTRYYTHHKHYKNGMIAQLGLTFRYNRSHANLLPSLEPADTCGYQNIHDDYNEKHPWIAALQATGINLLVHGFDRFVMNEEFAKVNMHTIHKNFQKGFVWDNDQFSTNLFAHPYHGNLYYNAARSNGLSFWESAPYALGGSLMWEFCGEIEPPAINDLMATTFGGICIGEITHRVSNVILNDRKRGFGRFMREFAATAICPMRGLNRMISGEAWHVSPNAEPYHDYKRFPVDFSVTAGTRYLADDGSMFRGEWNPYIALNLEYGDPFNRRENKPYDYFSADVKFGLSANQPLINALHLMGRIWSAPMFSERKVDAEVGIYQHFNYYDSKPVKDGSNQTPYRISEAASFGPGMMIRFPETGAMKRLEQRVFISGILLGGTKSDYYNVIDRDYNMGSGFSVKTMTYMDFRHFGRFELKSDYYRIFTWKGYEGKDLENINPLYLNAQGDKGNAILLVINPHWEIEVNDVLGIHASTAYFVRSTHYHCHPDVKTSTFEFRLGLTCHL